MDDNNHIDFNAPATLRKWPSIKNERARAADGPYLIVDGTLDDCIRQFIADSARCRPPFRNDVARVTRPLLAPIWSRLSALRRGTWMPTERLAMRHVRDVIRLKSAGMPTREIARRLGTAPASTIS